MDSHQIFRKIIEHGQSVSSFQNVNSLITTTQQDSESSVTIIIKAKKTPIAPLNQNHLQKTLYIIKDELKNMRSAQILFLQRSDDGKPYSGDICLPGGKVEKDQTPLQAALRQTMEEIGIQLSQDQLLGTLNHKFIAYKRGQTRLFTYAFVFLVDQTPELKLSQRQIVDYRWVPLNELMNQSVYQGLKIDTSHLTLLANSKDVKPHIKYIQYPSVNIGMKKNLYGLTLYILAFFVSKAMLTLQNTVSVLNQILTNNSKITNKLREKIIMMKKQLEIVVYFSTKFKNQYFQPLNIEFESQKISNSEKQQLKDQFFRILELAFPIRPKL